MVQLLYIIASLYVLLCPFTKVEESFNIQAFHDILYHRHNLSQYDHNEFPGVVPRTFVGPLIISAFSAPIVGVLALFGVSKFYTQYIVRLTLALSVIITWSRLRSSLQKQFGSTFSWWFTIVTVTQYHFMFYMSRPLPNIMVLPLVLLAFEGWLCGKHKQFIISAGASIIIFRSELAMLFGLFLLIDLYFKKIDVTTLFKIVLPAGLGLICLTVIVDSIFWQRLLWPEAKVFWFNTILNKSSNWGTSPFLWYFYSALPRGLGPSLFLIPVGVYLDRRLVPLVAPALVYIVLYSFLPHKELRFIIYVFPLFNIASAVACSYIYIRRTKAPVFELLFWGIIIIIIGNIAMSLSFVLVAMTNYPGGVAITRFHKILNNEPFVHVHISNLAAQTGVTRFTQLNDNWIYSKNESLKVDQLQDFTHLLIEAKSKYSPNLKTFAQTHIILDSIDTFSQVAMNYKLIPPVRIKTKPAIFILERKDFREYPQGKSIDSIHLQESSGSSQVSNEESEVNFGNNETSEEVRETELSFDKKQEVTKEIVVEDLKSFQSEDGIINDNSILDQEDVSEGHMTFEEIIPQTKKDTEELKMLRQERKKKAIAKIKYETQKEVVASAKEKLKEIMKRHKHIANEGSEINVSSVKIEENVTEDERERGDVIEDERERGDVTEDERERGDIPQEDLLDDEEPFTGFVNETADQDNKTDSLESMIEDVERRSFTNDDIDAIVEEVIVRLIDRKIYDGKTKLEDVTAEDRQIIKEFVEEFLEEKINLRKNSSITH